MRQQEQVLPFYLVCDESWSMVDEIDDMNGALVDLHKTIASNPVVADKTRLSLIGFAGSAEVLLPATSLDDLDTMPGLRCREGGTDFRAAFDTTRQQIDDDVSRMKDDEIVVLRPVCFFLSDGQHNADHEWLDTYKALVSPDFRAHPNIVAFGLGEANPESLSKIGTFKAFMADSSISPAAALKEFVGSLTRSIVNTATNTDGSGTPTLLVDDNVPGFTRLPLDQVA